MGGSSSQRQNTGYWQEPNPHKSSVEALATSPSKKNPTRARQKMLIQSDDTPRQIAWTHVEEIALAKGWVAVSENSKYVNTRKEARFWYEESGASDEDYVNRALINYQVETGNTFKYRHCWEILKDSLKWKTSELLKFATKSEGGNSMKNGQGQSER
nr:hypothetical protein [Tanacetum cinerariifolium]GEY96786.1 hypothetical protein [Tanacetum cinerariifolium]